jgi:hypothetical protein
VIAGDLNTFGHGLLRLSPFHCNDVYRFRSLFYEEAQVHFLCATASPVVCAS